MYTYALMFVSATLNTVFFIKITRSYSAFLSFSRNMSWFHMCYRKGKLAKLVTAVV